MSIDVEQWAAACTERAKIVGWLWRNGHVVAAQAIRDEAHHGAPRPPADLGDAAAIDQLTEERDGAPAVATALEEELARRVEAGDRMAELLAVDCLGRHSGWRFACGGLCAHQRARVAWKAIGAEA